VAVVARDRLPDARVTTIYNGADLSKFSPPTAQQRVEARTRFGFGSGDFVAGMVAGFRPEKSHDVFFAGLAQALSSIPTLKVLAVGGGELLSQFQEQISHSKLAQRVVFTGELTDVLPCLWSMDVACLTPGRNEGFSNALIEQMAVGLPLIVTDVGGNAEAVIDGVNGYVVPVGDAGALSAALIRMYQNREAQRAMGRASRQRAEERFSLDRMCAEHARLYQALCPAGPLVNAEQVDREH
jgi:glycosyltransferase involved in cell wall biosynthesis